MHIMAQISIHRGDQIESFEEMGWFDPDLDPKKAQAQTVNWLTNIRWSRDLYPDQYMDPTKVPPCIFIPQKQLLRRIIETVIQCADISEVRAKFCAY